VHSRDQQNVQEMTYFLFYNNLSPSQLTTGYPNPCSLLVSYKDSLQAGQHALLASPFPSVAYGFDFTNLLIVEP
jgi:hypothetical protein